MERCSVISFMAKGSGILSCVFLLGEGAESVVSIAFVLVSGRALVLHCLKVYSSSPLQEKTVMETACLMDIPPPEG